MKSFSKIGIPMTVFVSFILLVNTSGAEVYSQMQNVNQSGQSMSEPQMMNQSGQSMSEPQMMNQSGQSMSEPQMNEKLLIYTNMAIIALDDSDEDVVQENLMKIQGTILNSTDKQIIVVPSSAME